MKSHKHISNDKSYKTPCAPHNSKSDKASVTIKMFSSSMTMTTLCTCMLLLSTQPPSSALPTSGLVWCYWAGQAALSGAGCAHGGMMGPCGRVCLRGPGQMCGGRGARYGVCGAGMACSPCNRCTGCSASTGECFQDGECQT